MSSNSIEELKKARQINLKKKKSQVTGAILVTALILVALAIFLCLNPNYGVLWIIGIVIGLVMQRSRICFAASFRDPIMVGHTSLFRAMLIAFMVSTVGFFIIQYNSVGSLFDYDLSEVPGMIKPVGLHTALGALMFGIGMVIAGGCASGTLMRIGEGYIMQIVTLAGFIIGATLGASHMGFWDKYLISSTQAVYFPKLIGFFPAFIIQMIVLTGLYVVAEWYDRKNSIIVQ
jgi:uncharacterized protein